MNLKSKISLLVLFSFLSLPTFATDVGDGSDGTCDVLGLATTQITAAKKSYQCTTLTINADLNVFKGGAAGAGGDPLIIKVQGKAVIDSGKTINISGAGGFSGSSSAGIILGGEAGAGGGAGGNSPGLSLSGLAGSGTGGGGGGVNVDPAATFQDSTGGGGAGGTYKTQGSPVALEGDDGSPGGGAPGSSGVVKSIFGSENNFDTLFSGGSGGGAGGGGKVSNASQSGSSGGGGGGALRIIAGGNIEINGNILCDGGSGGGINTSTGIAGGGGGSGGGVWLQAAGAITVAGTISAIGGTEGTNIAQGIYGDGGAGGNGRIRLDDSDGVIASTVGVTPSPYIGTFTPTAITTSTGTSASVSARQYSSSVACGRVSEVGLEKQLPNFLFNIILGIFLSTTLFYSAAFFSREKV